MAVIRSTPVFEIEGAGRLGAGEREDEDDVSLS
jgi:hypothetical protein